MLYALVNKSTEVSDDDAITMLAAVQRQLTEDLCPAWGLVPPSLVFFKGQEPPPEAKVIVLLNSADQANALGYHDETPDGREYARVFASPVLDAGGSVFGTPDLAVPSVSSVLSHEACEMRCDEQCNVWALNEGTGELIALEVCDPVEASSYALAARDRMVNVSNFVLPAWFKDVVAPGGKYDRLGLLTEPFSIAAQGYVIKQGVDGNVQEVFGARGRAEWRQKLTSPASRTVRRKDR